MGEGWLLTEQYLEFLSLKGACTGSSESTFVKIQQCWKSHVAAHMFSDVVLITIIACVFKDTFSLFDPQLAVTLTLPLKRGFIDFILKFISVEF